MKKNLKRIIQLTVLVAIIVALSGCVLPQTATIYVYNYTGEYMYVTVDGTGRYLSNYTYSAFDVEWTGFIGAEYTVDLYAEEVYGYNTASNSINVVDGDTYSWTLY